MHKLHNFSSLIFEILTPDTQCYLSEMQLSWMWVSQDLKVAKDENIFPGRVKPVLLCLFDVTWKNKAGDNNIPVFKTALSLLWLVDITSFFFNESAPWRRSIIILHIWHFFLSQFPENFFCEKEHLLFFSSDLRSLDFHVEGLLLKFHKHFAMFHTYLLVVILNMISTLSAITHLSISQYIGFRHVMFFCWICKFKISLIKSFHRIKQNIELEIKWLKVSHLR